jgi:hypothetical protein
MSDNTRYPATTLQASMILMVLLLLAGWVLFLVGALLSTGSSRLMGVFGACGALLPFSWCLLNRDRRAESKKRGEKDDPPIVLDLAAMTGYIVMLAAAFTAPRPAQFLMLGAIVLPMTLHPFTMLVDAGVKSWREDQGTGGPQEAKR